MKSSWYKNINLSQKYIYLIKFQRLIARVYKYLTVFVSYEAKQSLSLIFRYESSIRFVVTPDMGFNCQKHTLKAIIFDSH